MTSSHPAVPPVSDTNLRIRLGFHESHVCRPRPSVHVRQDSSPKVGGRIIKKSNRQAQTCDPPILCGEDRDMLRCGAEPSDYADQSFDRRMIYWIDLCRDLGCGLPFVPREQLRRADHLFGHHRIPLTSSRGQFADPGDHCRASPQIPSVFPYKYTRAMEAST